MVTPRLFKRARAWLVVFGACFCFAADVAVLTMEMPGPLRSAFFVENAGECGSGGALWVPVQEKFLARLSGSLRPLSLPPSRIRLEVPVPVRIRAGALAGREVGAPGVRNSLPLLC